MMFHNKRNLGVVVTVFILAAFLGCATTGPVQLDTSTGKPEVVVKATMKSVAEYLTSEMLSWDYMIKNQTGNVLVFNKTMEYYQTSMFASETIPGEWRITYNLLDTSNGIRVMTTIVGVKYPNSAYEQVVEDTSKGTQDSVNLQKMLDSMKYRLETENPGKISVSMGDDYRTIEGVDKGGAAEKAGLQAKDIILSVDGVQTTNNPVENNKIIFLKQAGTTHEFTIERKGNIQNISVVFQERGDIPGKSTASPLSSETKTIPSDANIDLQGYGIISGAKIVSVTEGGPFEKAGMQKDDVMTMIDGDPVSSSGIENAKRLAGKPGTSVVVALKRGAQELTVAVIRTEIQTVQGDASINVAGIGAVIDGAKIVSLTAGGPAEKAGIRKGDVIVMIDGDTVSSSGVENSKRLAGKTNTSVVVTLKRGDQEITVPVIRKNP